MKITGTYRGLLMALAFVCLAAGLAFAAAWSLAPAEPEHGAQERTGIICGTPRGDCVISAQPVGTACTCPGGPTAAGAGVVVPVSVSRE